MVVQRRSSRHGEATGRAGRVPAAAPVPGAGPRRARARGRDGRGRAAGAAGGEAQAVAFRAFSCYLGPFYRPFLQSTVFPESPEKDCMCWAGKMNEAFGDLAVGSSPR